MILWTIFTLCAFLAVISSLGIMLIFQMKRSKNSRLLAEHIKSKFSLDDYQQLEAEIKGAIYDKDIRVALIQKLEKLSMFFCMEQEKIPTLLKFKVKELDRKISVFTKHIQTDPLWFRHFSWLRLVQGTVSRPAKDVGDVLIVREEIKRLKSNLLSIKSDLSFILEMLGSKFD